MTNLGARVLVAFAVICGGHGVVNAQQQPPSAPPPVPPPAPPQPPPGYGPPPGYPPPVRAVPPQGYGQPPPRYYYPPPPPPPPPRPAGIRRPLTVGLGLGVGALNVIQEGYSQGDYGLSYTFRLGVGLVPNLILSWDVEGTSIAADAVDDISQTAHLAALQWFPFGRRLYLKGGLGAAYVTDTNPLSDVPRDWAGAWMAGVGYELLQAWHSSFAVEFTSTWARYSQFDETWNNNGVNFVVSWF